MEEINLRIEDVIRILKNRWIIIVGISVTITLVVSIISFFVIRPVYKVSTKVFVGKEQNQEVKYDNNDVEMYQKLLKTYSELIKSNDLIENAINRSNLEISPGIVSNSLGVTPMANTQILEVSYEDYDNELAKEVLESVVNEFIKSTKELIPNGKVQVIERAKLPQYPVKPNKIIYIALGCLISLMIGIIIAFFFEYMDDTLKTKEQTEKLVDVPVIGMILCEKNNYSKRRKAKHVKTQLSV